MAFNGALSWKTFNDFYSTDYLMSMNNSAMNLDKKFLTTMPKDNYYIKPTQDIILNYASYAEPTTGTTELLLYCETNTADVFFNQLVGWGTQYPIVQQINVKPSNVGISQPETVDYYDVWLESNGVRESEKRRFYIDH